MGRAGWLALGFFLSSPLACSSGDGRRGDGGTLTLICGSLSACPYLTPDASTDACERQLVAACAGDLEDGGQAQLADAAGCLLALPTCDNNGPSEEDYANVVVNCQPFGLSGGCEAAVSTELHGLQGRVGL